MIRFLSSAFFVALILFCGAARSSPHRLDAEGEVREAIDRAFGQLRSGDYAALYDGLPAASQRRISKARFTSSLSKTRGMYDLQRMEVGRIAVSSGDQVAVADTVIYAQVQRPFTTEGKIAVQQYLVRENGKWRVATGDRTTSQRLLAKHPDFARRYPSREPRVYIKRDGRWVELGSIADLRQRLGI